MNLPVADLTEKQFQTAVIDAARFFGYKVAHFRSVKTPKGWQTPVQADGAGFPDLCCVRDDRAVWIELKAKRGVVSEPQKDWLRLLLAGHHEAYICRPADFDDLAYVLRSRGRVFDGAAWDAHQRLTERTRAEVER